MDRCQITLTRKAVEKYAGPLLVFIVSTDGKKSPKCDEIIRKQVKDLFTLGDFKGKKDETALLYPENKTGDKRFSCKRILLAGTGELKKDDNSGQTKELFRTVGGNICTIARKVKATELLLVIPEFVKDSDSQLGGCLVEGILLGNYQFKKYKKKQEEDQEKEEFEGIKKISVIGRTRALRNSLNSAQIRAEAALTARDMANEPANNWTPDHFSRFALHLAKETDLTCRVLGKTQLQKLGMGGILGVNQGSAIDPKMVILEYKPKRYRQTILLVGKGITFDSGGVSLKPAAGMEDMKYDMCGGAAVMAAMQGIARQKPKVRVAAIVPATENMSGASALKPGDVITHYNGVTAEIVNTDAEGRLILADALAYGIEKYKPDCVVDLATLTGAVIIGLGHHRTGLLSNNDGLADALCHAGEETGEKLWRLPLDQEYIDQIDSEVADIKNVGGRPAGSITAAAYLLKFVGDTPWAHLDIAGTAWEYTKKSYIPKGPSGIGVRLLLNFVNGWSRLKL